MRGGLVEQSVRLALKISSPLDRSSFRKVYFFIFNFGTFGLLVERSCIVSDKTVSNGIFFLSLSFFSIFWNIKLV